MRAQTFSWPSLSSPVHTTSAQPLDTSLPTPWAMAAQLFHLRPEPIHPLAQQCSNQHPSSLSPTHGPASRPYSSSSSEPRPFFPGRRPRHHSVHSLAWIARQVRPTVSRPGRPHLPHQLRFCRAPHLLLPPCLLQPSPPMHAAWPGAQAPRITGRPPYLEEPPNPRRLP
jgi:hypothetical protein